MGLTTLSRRALAECGHVSDDDVRASWSRALSSNGDESFALVSLLEDWGQFEGLDWETMLRKLGSAARDLGTEITDRPSDPGVAASLYDETEALTPLLLWWHGTELKPARYAAISAAAFSAAGAKRVLDFGSGIGSTALFFAAAGYEPVLSEVARKPLKFSQWRLERRGHGPAEALDLWDRPLSSEPPESLDGAVAFDVLEHVPDIEPHLRDLDRALAPGGILCFSQVYVSADEGPHHYPQRGEALVWLHDHGYRLAHVPKVCWLAQKAPLPAVERRLQRASIQARIGATVVAERLRGPGARAMAHTMISRSLD